MEQTLWAAAGALAVWLVCGLTKLAFTKPGPYRRLFLIINEMIFFAGLCYSCAMLGYLVGGIVVAFNAGLGDVDDLYLSPWIFAPQVVLFVMWRACYILLVLPSKIGIEEE